MRDDRPAQRPRPRAPAPADLRRARRRGARGALRPRAGRLAGRRAARSGPRFVFGAAGLTLERPRRRLEECARAGGSRTPPTRPATTRALVEEAIAAVRDRPRRLRRRRAGGAREPRLPAGRRGRAARAGVAAAGGIEPLPPEPPHPHWMDEARVREALAASSRRTRLGRLRPRRPGAARAQRREPATPELSALLRALPALRPVRLAGELPRRLGGDDHRPRRREALQHPAPRGRAVDRRRRRRAARSRSSTLDFLARPTYANGEPVRRGDYLEECGASYAADARAMRARKGYADIVYGHARHDGDGRLWLQYWFFYYYNDKGLLDIGQHEGDWEMVQLRLGEDGQPDAATYGQHAGAERAALGRGRAPADRRRRGAGRLLARAARTPRFRGPAAHEAPVVPDHNDGLGPRLRPRLVTIGDDGAGLGAVAGALGVDPAARVLRGRQPPRAARAAAVVGPGRAPRGGAPGAGGAALGDGSSRHAAAGARRT